MSQVLLQGEREGRESAVTSWCCGSRGDSAPGVGGAGSCLPIPAGSHPSTLPGQQGRRGCREFHHIRVSFPLEWEIFVRQKRIPLQGLKRGGNPGWEALSRKSPGAGKVPALLCVPAGSGAGRESWELRMAQEEVLGFVTNEEKCPLQCVWHS